MPQRLYPITIKGQDPFDMPWDGPGAPTPLDVKQYIWEQKHPKQKGFLEDTWDKVMTPFTDAPSRAARALTGPAREFDKAHEQMPVIPGSYGNLAPAFTEAVGDTATSMTSPGQLALLAATGGEYGAAKFGMTGLANALSVPGRVAAAGMIGHGGYKMYEEPTWAGKAGGAVEAGLGLLGVRGRAAQAARAAKVADIGWAEDAAAAAESEAPRAQQRLLSGRVAPIEPPRGPTRPMGPSSLDPNIPIEGEVIPGPPQPRLGGQTLEQRNLPPLNNRGLPPARPTYYQGAGGTALDDIDAAGTPRVTYQGGRGLLPPDRAPVRNWSDARARIATPEPPLAPITAEPIAPVQQPGPRDILEQNSPYGMNYLRQQAPEAPPIQAPPVAPPVARPVARPVAPPVVDIPPIGAPPVQAQRPPIVAGPMKAAPSVPIGDITSEIPGSTIPPIVDTAPEVAPKVMAPVSKAGRVKLYRWQPDDPAAAKGAGNWYVDNPKKIDFYRTDRGPGKIVAMELSPEQAERFRVPTDPAAPGFKADPNGEFYLPSSAKKNVVGAKAGAEPVTAERPYAKVSDGDIATLVKTGDAKAVAEAQARPNLWEKIKTWYKDPAQQKGSVDMRGMLGMDKEGTPSPISGATTSEAEVAAPKKPMSLRELLGFKGKGPEIDSETLPHAHNLDQWVDMVRQEDGVGDDIIQAAIKGAHRRGIDPTRSWGGLEELSDFMKDMEHTRLNDPEDYAAMVKQGIIENPKFKALNQASERPRPDWKSEKGSWDMRGTFGGGEKPPVPPTKPPSSTAAPEVTEPVPPKSWREKLGLPASAKENPHAARFADWVNQLRAAKSEGQLVSKKFTDLDAGGFDTVKKFQKGDVSGRLGDARKYLDAKFQELTDAGVPLEHRQHYVTQIWKDDPSKVIETYRRLGLKPSMSLQRTFDTYEQGMAAGLTPKFDKMSDILGFYEQRANKAIADRQYFNYLREKGFIRPKGKGELDWKTLDPDHFPSTSVKGKDGVVKVLPETAPPELHQMISNYLADPNKQIEKWANRATFSKNLAMSTGVPWTGINAHGANIMARTIMGNTKETGTALKYILRPSTGAKYIEENFQHVPEAVRAGLTISTEGHELGETLSKNLVDKGLNKVLAGHGKLFEDPLFQKIIPALKLKHWREMTEDLVKSGLTQEAAGKRAAEFTNNLYGGINWEAMGKNRDFQNLLRATVLAPDWAQSNINLGKGLVTGLKKKEYQKLAAGMIGSYVAADVVNYAQNGNHMYENPTGHALDIKLGKSSDGTDRYLRPFGTAADFARLPYEAASSMMQGNLGATADILKNRSSITARTTMDVLLNKGTNQLPIFNKDAYGRKIPMLEGNPKINRGQSQLGGLTREVAHLAAPPYAQALADYYLGKSNAEQAIVQGGELAPLRYTRPPSPKFKRGF